MHSTATAGFHEPLGALSVHSNNNNKEDIVVSDDDSNDKKFLKVRSESESGHRTG